MRKPRSAQDAVRLRPWLLAVAVWLGAFLLSRAAGAAAESVEVTTTGDSGPGSLREAIAYANAHSGTTIRFAIPGSGVRTIQPLSALPTVTAPVIIDGYTQPGAQANTLAVGNDAVLLIELDGGGAGNGSALAIEGGNSTLRGLVVRGFHGDAVVLRVRGGNTVAGCFIGTDSTGTIACPNVEGDAHWPAAIKITDVPDNLIGGGTPAARNLISANEDKGIWITGAAAQGNRIQGNYIGTNAAGTALLGSQACGVLLQNTTGSLVGGTAAGERNLISGNSGVAVQVESLWPTSDRIQGNYIGTNAAGTAAIGNAWLGNFGAVVLDAPGITLGGTDAGAGNLVAGPGGIGVLDSAVIQGNLIGTDATGTAALPNSPGIGVYGGSEVLIGGTTPAARNLIAGTVYDGVRLMASGARVQGNYIGTDISGQGALPNGQAGVRVAHRDGGSEPADNLIGGTEADAGNVISGNTGPGVFIEAATVGTQVLGNLIGLDATGTTARPNGDSGIYIQGGRNVLVGGTTAAARNTISGNASHGIRVEGGATGVQILGNFVGTDVTGALARGNTGAGVAVLDGSAVLGGTAQGAGNRIANNYGSGIWVASAAQGVRLRGNAVYANGGLGLDLEPAGVTANDAGDGDTGANGLQNIPVLQVVYAGVAEVGFCGTLDTPTPGACALDFFANDTRDPSGYGEGKTYLGSGTPLSDGRFAVTVAGSIAVGTWVSATATDASGNTSEFSQCVTAVASDDDGLPDAWEQLYFGDFSQGPADDPDGDGFTNAQEYAIGTRPNDMASAPVYSWTNFVGMPGGPGNADGTGSAARFNQPAGVATDSAGNVFVADNLNCTIRKVIPQGATGVVITLAGSPGQAGSADGTGSAARFWDPAAVAVDGAGNVFVAEPYNHTIRKITPAGVVSTLAGSVGTPGPADGTGGAAQFNTPTGVATDSAGNVFVADQENHAIRKVTRAGLVTTLAGLAGSPGSADGTGSAARFSQPAGVAVDAVGNVFVADYGNSVIRKVTSAGEVTTLAGLAGAPGSTDGTGSAARFDQPTGVALDGAGNVYVADRANCTIRAVTPAGVVTTLAGLAGVSGVTDGTGSAARFSGPQDVAADSAGNVLVADNHTIRRVTPAGVVTTLAGSAGSPPGSADGTGSTARLHGPEGVAVDGVGNVFVADYGNGTIRKVIPQGETGVVITLAGSPGQAGSADGTGSNAQFDGPLGVAVDSGGRLLVADRWNHTIREISPAGGVTTLAGSPGVSGSADGTGADARFSYPSGVAVDGAGNVFVGDDWNHTIRRIAPGGVVTTLAGSPGVPGGRMARAAPPGSTTRPVSRWTASATSSSRTATGAWSVG